MWPLWLLALAFVFGLGWYLGEKHGEDRENRERRRPEGWQGLFTPPDR